MSNFDKKTLEDLERLCRIKCTKEENIAILTDLKKIIDYIEELAEVDTENVPSCRSVLGSMHQNVTREDVVGKTLSTSDFLSNAPDQIGGMIRIPPVLKSE